ncbi:MAG TPA: hypothetical protein VGH59_01900 [Casimicrobiaceae bacterium]|jgi:hypothetical protein
MLDRNTPAYLDLVDSHGHYHPQGEVSLTEGVELVTQAIVFCRDSRIPRLLVDLTLLTGYAAPTLDDRYWMAQDWAAAAKGTLVLALVAHAEQIHPGKFGVTVANDAGLKSDVFTSPAEALQWLLGMMP